MRRYLIAPLLVLSLAGPVQAQQRAQRGQQPAPPPAALEEPRLVFEREVFSYPAGGRRDPFRALTQDASGPVFEELTLHMIIFSAQPGESIAVLADPGGRRHRVRRGQSVGNATVIDIGPTRVVFTVDYLGVRRQEVLELPRTTTEGA